MTTAYEARLETVVNQLEKFINGKADETVSTDNGLVPTISGALKQTKQFNHVLPLIDYKRHSDLLSDALANLLKAGQIYRVWGDASPIKNGFYQVDETDISIPVKTDFADIYDLKQNLPDPWSYVAATIYGAEMGTKKVCSWLVSKTSVDAFIQSLDGTLHSICTSSGSEKMTQQSFKLMFAYNELYPNRVKQKYTVVHSDVLNLGSTNLPDATVKIWVDVVDSSITNIVRISLSIQQIGVLDLSNYKFDVVLRNYKKSNFMLS